MLNPAFGRAGGRFSCIMILVAVGLPVDAQQAVNDGDGVVPEATARDGSQPEARDEGEPAANSSGRRRFGGPSSVSGTIRRDNRVNAWVDAYFDFKDRLQKRRGLEYGFGYMPVYQGASESLGDDRAADGVGRLYCRWELVNRGTKNNGALVGKAEYRHSLGTDVSPQDLGSEIGYAGLTVTPFGELGWTLPNLFWEQHLAGDRVAFVAGIVDVADYLNAYGLNDQWTHFFNQAFSTDPTIPAPGQGLGAAIRGQITSHLYLAGGIADANGDPTDPGGSWSSFFDAGEHFKHVEFGWIASPERRFTDNAHVALWHVDDLVEAQVQGGWGVALSWNRLLDSKWHPFFRAGYASGGGALWDRSLSGGFGYFTRGDRDMLGIGLSWSRPSQETFGRGLNDQYTAEIFYRWRPVRMLTISPDIQLLVDPALNPEEDLIIVAGLRLRLAL